MDYTTAKYRNYRAQYPGIPARTALAWARGDDKPRAGWEWDTHGDTATIERDGFSLKLTIEYDDYPDTSYLGEWSDTFEPGAIAVTDDMRYRPAAFRIDWKWFIPGISAEEHRRGLSAMGYARHTADCLARSYVLRDMRRLSSDTFALYVVSVSASREGIELGSACIGGVDIDDTRDMQAQFEDIADDYGLIDEATSDARMSLKALTEGMV